MDSYAAGEARHPGLRLAERVIPIPTSISPEAQASLALERPVMPPYPPIEDKAAWNALIPQMNAALVATMRRRQLGWRPSQACRSRSPSRWRCLRATATGRCSISTAAAS